jgi:transposase
MCSGRYGIDTRYRSRLAAERARLESSIHKVLEDTHIKLTSVATDITGQSGRAILDALLDGQDDPQVLAELARGRRRSKRNELAQAVQGTLSEHHRFLLKSQLRQLDFFDTQVGELDQEIAHRLGVPSGPDDPDPSADQLANAAPPEAPALGEPAMSTPALAAPSDSPKSLSSAQAIRSLDEVTGINVRIAQMVVAELGTQLIQFPDQAHLVSWAGLCPAAKISAGKRLSTQIGKGNPWLRQALIQAAQAAARSKDTYLGAYYQRLKKRMGGKKAIIALAHRLLVIISPLLKEQQSYRELGPGHADEQAVQASTRWAVRRLEQLGYQVTLQPAEGA